MMNVNHKISHQPAFNGKFRNILKNLDFCDSNTPKSAAMILYTGCIASRLVNSRDKYEFRETLTRDSIGWTSLFFAAVWAEKAIGYLSELFGRKREGDYTGLFIGKNTKEAPNSLWDALKPGWMGGKYKIRSFEDIKSLESKFPDIAKNIMKHKYISYIASFGVAIAILGIFIPWVNVITTRHQFKATKDNNNLLFS